MKRLLIILAAGLLLAGCAPSAEEVFGKIRQTQAVAEQRVDTYIKGALSFTCDLDVKRLNKLSQEEPGFQAFFWERCGAQYGAVIDGAIDYRNAHPTPMVTVRGQ